jgi:GntR family transcriptional regulator
MVDYIQGSVLDRGLVHDVMGGVDEVYHLAADIAPASANRTASRILSVSDEMRRSGRVPHSRVVSSGRRAASDDESRRLATDEVFAVRRVREADGEPVALETAVFPAARAEALAGRDLQDVSLFAALTEAGHVPTAGTATNAERATAEDAVARCAAGEPLPVERRLINDQDGVPLELTESRYVGTRYGLDVDFEVELPNEPELTDFGPASSAPASSAPFTSMRCDGWGQVAGVSARARSRAAKRSRPWSKL